LPAIDSDPNFKAELEQYQQHDLGFLKRLDR
jgi:hypothetical protein